METQHRASEELGRVDWVVLAGVTMLLAAASHVIAGAVAIVKDILRKTPSDAHGPGTAQTASPAEVHAERGSWFLLGGLFMALGAIFHIGRGLVDILKDIMRKEPGSA